MTPRLNLVLFAILASLIVPYYWLFFDNRPGNPQPKPIDVAQLRKLATQMPGELPRQVQYEILGQRYHMRNFSAAGRGLRPEKVSAMAYRLDYGDKPPVLIGTGMTELWANRAGYREYSRPAFERVLANLETASNAILLGSGEVHAGGLKALEDKSEKARARIDMAPGLGPDASPHAVAPGVVVVPANSVRANMQLAFVKLGNGREYLFAGPLSPTIYNVEDLRAPSRWVTDVLEASDRKKAYVWLATIRKWQRQAPGLVLVSGGGLPKNAALQDRFPIPAEK